MMQFQFHGSEHMTADLSAPLGCDAENCRFPSGDSYFETKKAVARGVCLAAEMPEYPRFTMADPRLTGHASCSTSSGGPQCTPTIFSCTGELSTDDIRPALEYEGIEFPKSFASDFQHKQSEDASLRSKAGSAGSLSGIHALTASFAPEDIPPSIPQHP